MAEPRAQIVESNRPQRLSVCLRERAPLIPTMVFPQHELYCLECGAKYGLFGALTVDTTDELWARYEALKAEWDEHAGPKLITPRSWRGTCGKCFERPGENPHGTREHHEEHATDDERAADREARLWLAERASVAA